MAFVYSFDFKHKRPPMEMKDLLGGKGANLAEMTSVLQLPVPPGFTISTDACREYIVNGWPEGLDAEIQKARLKLEKQMGKIIGDPSDPLLVSVRSGAKFSMPGMMDTVLNLGLNDKSVKGLANQTNDERFAYDSYRRFISMYGRIVLEIPEEEFSELFDAAKELSGTTSDSEVPIELLKYLVEAYKKVVKSRTKKAFPQDPAAQLKGAIEAVFRSWNGARAIAYRNKEKIPHDLGTAVNVQAMVFGNRDNNSGTGVGFTRDPASGNTGVYGDFLVNAQGEDVVAGIRNTEKLSALNKKFPKVYKELMNIFMKLETHYRDMCDTEFTIEQGKLWMLQTRVGKRTGNAALKMAVNMMKDPHIKLTKAEALMRISEENLEQVLHPQFATKNYKVAATGLGASPGAAVGHAFFTADDAASQHERGKRVILIRTETSPEDVHGMLAAEGILTSRGGLVSHAAVVARGWGKPAVVGAEAIKIQNKQAKIGDIVIKEGDLISIDGTTGVVVLGEVPLTQAEPPNELKVILNIADEFRKGKLKVRANADTGADAQIARNLGAEGIGLCRTEHMFLGDDRLPVVRAMILAEDPADEAAALDELKIVQKLDFYEILKAMSGLPVTVRLLDPPLHEFLPDVHELQIKKALGTITQDEEKLLAAGEKWKEFNPMLGIRGVRLGVIKPGLYSMQVEALMEAAMDLAAEGKEPIVEIMIPLTVSRDELGLAKSWVQSSVDKVQSSYKPRSKSSNAVKTKNHKVVIGTMIETPRAALVADEIAENADFFSFGTNDLTQMTFGFSRDDVEGRMMKAYLDQGLLKRNPFDTLDSSGVGQLVKMGVEKGRKNKPELKTGVCGEHGGDPESIHFFYGVGLDYVSCSPYRVPVARLAAAQAVLSDTKKK